MPPDTGTSARKLKIQIEVRDADILAFEGDGIVLPTNSEGLMLESLTARVKDAGGRGIEEEVKRSSPIAVGAAVVTKGGSLPFAYIIHCPVTEQPGMKVAVENIRRATRAGLLAATHVQLEKLAIPGIGFGENGVPHDEAARAVIDEVRGYRGPHPSQVVLIETDPEMLFAFRQQLGEI